MGNLLAYWLGSEMDSTEQTNVSPTSPNKDNSKTNSEGTEQNIEQIIGADLLQLGEHENQVSEGGETCLQYHMSQCVKNPDHQQFIPIYSLTLHHLPKGYQDSDLLELIKATADLTVRISVSMTSPNRPQFWPNTNIPYHLSYLSGQKTLRTGTGRVSGVWKYTDNQKRSDYETCPCEKCKDSDNPSKVWWKIYVYTAAHVVFDDIEASETRLRLFYDRENGPKVILKDKVRVHYVNIEQDKCRFTCVTCNENIGNALQKMKKHYYNAWEKVKNKYSESKNIHKLNYIVSHPHGCSKQVSIGQWKHRVNVGDNYNKFTYTTSTCPGSSGAFVNCVGYNTWLNDPVHSGILKPGLNYSGAGGVWN